MKKIMLILLLVNILNADNQALLNQKKKPLFSPRIHYYKYTESRIEALTVSYDGNYIISGSEDGSIKVWDTKKEKLVLILKDDDYAITSLSISKDGSKIISGSEDGSIRIWDIFSEKVIKKFRADNCKISALSIDFEHYNIVTKGCGKVNILDSRTGKIKWFVKSKLTIPYFPGVISKNGRWMVLNTYEGEVVIWDIVKKKKLRTLFSDEDMIMSINMSPDSSKIMIDFAFNKMKIWDKESGKKIHDFKLTKNINFKLLNSKASKIIAQTINTDMYASYSSDVKIWNSTMSKLLLTLNSNDEEIRNVIMTEDERKIIGASYFDGKIFVWDANTGKIIQIFKKFETKKATLPMRQLTWYDYLVFIIIFFIFLLIFLSQKRNHVIKNKKE